MVLLQTFGVLTYIFSIVGNGLFIGIAHYEKYGQDPQKRSFPDQISSFNCLLFTLTSFIWSTILEIRSLFGPIGNVATLIFYSNNSLMLCIPLGFAECILFKCLLIFFWKKFAAINDDFFATFFNMFNVLIVGLIISLFRLMNGEYYLRYDFEIISGVEISKIGFM